MPVEVVDHVTEQEQPKEEVLQDLVGEAQEHLLRHLVQAQPGLLIPEVEEVEDGIQAIAQEETADLE
jgi:hypothetical protein